MRILICDDDELVINELCKLLNQFFDNLHIKTPEISCYTNGAALLADKGTKDIIFLDVEMPGMNGIYVGNELKRTNADSIIFIVTSFSEYLDEAMRFHVFRYLSKPLEKQRFFRNMRDALDLYHSVTIKIPIETKEGIVMVSTSAVITVEAKGRKVIVHTTQCDYESIHNMEYWIEQLPPNSFFQTHRSYIINLEHVCDFNHTLIHLADNQFIAYLTKRKYSSFKNAYLLYLESTR